MNNYFRFKQFLINQDQCAMKVSTDSCLFGAWVAQHEKGPARILDIGSGTGLLILMLAQKFACPIEGIEIDENCYGQLLENVEASDWNSRITIHSGDARTQNFGRSFDLIVSNPPFYEKQLKSDSATVNAARHSTNLALEELFEIIHSTLAPGGRFAVLIPYYRTEEVIVLAGSKGLFPLHHARVRHSTAHAWYRSMIFFAKEQMDMISEDINIHDEQGNYSQSFKGLMKDYYLFL